MAGPPVEVQARVNVGVGALSSDVSSNCTEDTVTLPVREIQLVQQKGIFIYCTGSKFC